MRRVKHYAVKLGGTDLEAKSGMPGKEDGPIRSKALTARNNATMMTVVDTGEYGRFILDEPAGHGGTGQGPSPLQAVLGALCGCEAVTFRRAATEMGLAYQSLSFDAAYTIDIRGRQGDRSVRTSGRSGSPPPSPPPHRSRPSRR